MLNIPVLSGLLRRSDGEFIFFKSKIDILFIEIVLIFSTPMLNSAIIFCIISDKEFSSYWKQ